jgi:putative membrane protein insertion efficiency factor
MKRLFILFVRGYQLMISPFTANHCRFHPTCSRYAIIAIERHGALMGSWLAIKRIGRCRPGCEPGVDPVPTVAELEAARQSRKKP